MADHDDRLDSAERQLMRQAAEEATRFGEIRVKQVGDLFLDDVRISARRFSAQIHALQVVGSLCPMVLYESGDLAPLDVLASADPAFAFAGNQVLSAFAPKQIYDFQENARGRAANAGMPIRNVEPKEAEEHFARRLYEFLSRRFTSARGWFGGGGPPAGTIHSPGLEVTVHTNNAGYRIHATPHFFPSLGGVFGNSLSTPV